MEEFMTIRSFVKSSSRGFVIDAVQRFHSLLVDQLILDSIEWFLSQHFSRREGQRLLDLGAGSRPYEAVYRPYFREYVAMDVPHAEGVAIDVWGSAEQLPFKDDSMDAILFTEVLEHLPHPGQALRECSRVLRPGGQLFLSVPFLNPLHEVPNDYHRFTPFALVALGRAVGLELTTLIEKGGLGAFSLLFVIYLQVLALMKLSGRLGIPLLSPKNPMIWLFMIWPQKIYLWAWHRRGSVKGHQWDAASGNYSAFRPVTLGYIAFFRKN
ncbi:MAG: class I SAM-dependent methyltransferase [Gammaproteobacteria bacterium]|nr:class I SAM-dependent methyltransferase [Gammaproteobacteria bacterium]